MLYLMYALYYLNVFIVFDVRCIHASLILVENTVLILVFIDL